MSQSTVAPGRARGLRPVGPLAALRTTALLSTLIVLYQAATAGQILMRSEAAEEWHGGGAIALHVATGLMTLAAFWHLRTSRGPWWPTVVSAIVFVATFVEASYGHGRTLYIHVPLALALTIGTVWMTAWAFTGGATAGARTR